MSRIKDLQKYVHHVVEGNDKEANQIAHLHGVALAAAILAKKRGEDAELATMAGLLHDLYAYKEGSYDDHAHLGADYARKVLKKLEITTDEETEIICTAMVLPEITIPTMLMYVSSSEQINVFFGYGTTA